MSTAYVVVTVLAAVMVGASAGGTFARAPFVVDVFAEYGVPESWYPQLASVKAVGAAGLLVGLAVPAIGALAGLGLVLYFLGAIATVSRAGFYTHIPIPLVYMAPVVGSLVLGLTA